MANVYKNAFYAPVSIGLPETIFTCPTEARAIFQTIQLTNTGGNKTVKVYIYDSSATKQFTFAKHTIAANESQSMADGTVILEENDVLRVQAASADDIEGTVSILEFDRT